MARKRFSDEDCLRLLREIELQLAGNCHIKPDAFDPASHYAPAMRKISYRRHRFPPVIIQHAVWRRCHINRRISQLGQLGAKVMLRRSRIARCRTMWFEALCKWPFEEMALVVEGIVSRRMDVEEALR